MHVIQRGNNKAACFVEERDYRFYLSLLDELSPLYQCDVHAYVLMTNHVHLLFSPRTIDGPSLLMKYLGQRFVQYMNRKHGRSGRLFEGRFRSCIVDSDAYLLTCQRYIEMNPVRAGMVNHPSDYRWSSYRTNADGLHSDFIIPHDLYFALGADPEARLRGYRALFEMPQMPSELEQIRNALNSGRALTTETLLSALDEPTRERATVRQRGRPPRAMGRSA